MFKKFNKNYLQRVCLVSDLAIDWFLQYVESLQQIGLLGTFISGLFFEMVPYQQYTKIYTKIYQIQDNINE